ncbi:DUF5789 family protein [Haloparvum sedimenti]|uniref:DUF5789 family protein n=1 Tax=Haloparvum sedimenti TaxID=1678448 RepID=UPI00071E79BA|nr:hypothetical protein [Haloparvum sedimenti]
MADTKDGREKQARNADRRQRERDIAAEMDRWDDAEPPIDPGELAYFEADLESVSFPATGREIVETVGDKEIAATDGSHAVAELLPDADAETFVSPESVRVRVQRPTVARAMKRVVEAVDRLPDASLDDSQRDAYARTLRELEAVSADDENEGVRAIADWIVERTREDEKAPGSRDVRRRAAEFCRENGYEVRDDEWLGV